MANHTATPPQRVTVPVMRQGTGAATPVLQPAPSSASGRAMEALTVAARGGAGAQNP
jgi:hypothetical protein